MRDEQAKVGGWALIALTGHLRVAVCTNVTEVGSGSNYEGMAGEGRITNTLWVIIFVLIITAILIVSFMCLYLRVWKVCLPWLREGDSVLILKSSPSKGGSALFPKSYPMLVMRWAVFQKLTDIPRSDRAARENLLIEHELGVHDAIFISHRWWGIVANATVHDAGRPDTADNLKFSIICKGVQSLIEQFELDPTRLVLWLDWYSINQDNMGEKLEGVKSLIHYATCCEIMLIPLREEDTDAAYPDQLVEYGERAWCRCENFVFSCYSAMLGKRKVALFAQCGLTGALKHFDDVKFTGAGDMPHQGDLTVQSDKANVLNLEQMMIDAFGDHVVQQALVDDGSTELELGGKMLHDAHIHLFATLLVDVPTSKRLTALWLNNNKMGDSGLKAVSSVIGCDALADIETLSFSDNIITSEGVVAFAEAMSGGSSLVLLHSLYFDGNMVGDAGLEAFARGIASGGLANLKDLWLGTNKIGDAGMMYIAQAIANGGCAKLETLDLYQNQIADSGACFLASLCTKETFVHLKILYVGHNLIGNPGIMAFSEALEGGGLVSLRELYLHGNAGISEVDVEKLLSAASKRGVVVDLSNESDREEDPFGSMHHTPRGEHDNAAV